MAKLAGWKGNQLEHNRKYLHTLVPKYKVFVEFMLASELLIDKRP